MRAVGTKAVISATFSVYSERTFNNLQRNFEIERLRKEFFNSHMRLHKRSGSWPQSPIRIPVECVVGSQSSGDTFDGDIHIGNFLNLGLGVAVTVAVRCSIFPAF